MFRIIIWIVAALAVLFTGSLWYGQRSWEDATARMHTRIEASREPLIEQRYDPDQLAELPEPVQRYLQLVLQPGQPLVRSVQLRQDGEFNLGEESPRWVPFTAEQFVVTRRPGFNWNARVRIAPGVQVFVHDAYVAGEGIVHASLFGLLTIAEQRRTPEIAHGELMRFLAETPWYPTALLPGQGVTWEAIDAHAARASLSDGDTTVTLVFHFASDGLVDHVRADARHRGVGGAQVATPWEGHFRNYDVRNGMRVPLRGEVAWLLPEGRLPYWQGTLRNIRHETAR